MTWKSNKGKSKLIKEIVAKGFSYRKAEKAVNAVFTCMARGVVRGEKVEIPGGTIAKGLGTMRRRKWQKFRYRATGKCFYRLFDYGGRKYSIVFRSDKALKLDQLPAQAPP